LLNAFRLKKVKRLNTVQIHAVTELQVQHIVLALEMVGPMQVLLAIKAHPFFLNG